MLLRVKKGQSFQRFQAPPKAIPAGYWNIDIDTSTLVDPEQRGTLREQQYNNFMRSAGITKFVREIETRRRRTISLGGEIGEVGEKNSTPEELEAYMSGYAEAIDGFGRPEQGQRQHGTSHGGIVLPDGTIKKVAVDFDTLKIRAARREYGAGGRCSTAPAPAPATTSTSSRRSRRWRSTLATGFMNVYMDHDAFPGKPDEPDQPLSGRQPLLTSARKARPTSSSRSRRARRPSVRSSPRCGPWRPSWRPSTRRWRTSLRSSTTSSTSSTAAELIDRIVTPVEYHKPMPAAERGVGDMGLAD